MRAPTMCTIVARNYLPGARVLTRSIRDQHPDADVVVLLLDDRDEEFGHDEPFRVVRPRHVGLDGTLGHEMAGIYSLIEFATAAKPWLIEHLIRSTGSPVLYLDPDCDVHAPLDELLDLTERHTITVTPHTLRPFPRDGLMTGELEILAAGIYNLGYLGVAPDTSGLEFLRYWKERLRRDAIVDPKNMIFTDQRWVDFIDCFPHFVVRDPACNVAYWNIWGRSLAQTGPTLLADGVPLRFFHFSGFDPLRPHLLSIHQAEQPRVLLSEHPILAELCANYATRLMAEGYVEYQEIPYGWGRTDTGLNLDATMRLAWRTALLDADAAGLAPPRGPFDTDGGLAFTEWLREPAAASGISRYELALWSHHMDLQFAFPQCPQNQESAQRLAEWLATNTTDQRALHARAHLGPPRRDPRRHAPISQAPLPGLNIFGYLSMATGVGQAGRLLADAAASVGLGTSTQSSRLAPSLPGAEMQPPLKAEWVYDTNLFCVNADMLGENLAAVPHASLLNRRNAGMWFWEAEVFPEAFLPAFDMLDEIWAPSRFIADALGRTGDRQIRRLPLPFPIPKWSSSVSRADLGLPEGFLVLFTFDWNSVRERKNPDGLIDAYCRAFSPDEGAHLVIKSFSGHQHWRQLEQFKMSIRRPDIHIVDGLWKWWQVKAALELCDCYASLHRSEGLGLSMGEAMALGKPVVATAWSGNMDFMDSDTAHLIPASLIPIPDSTPVYAGCGRWAEPDLDAAASALRRIHDDPGGATALGTRAQAHMAANRSLETTGRALLALCDQLRFRQSAA